MRQCVPATCSIFLCRCLDECRWLNRCKWLGWEQWFGGCLVTIKKDAAGFFSFDCRLQQKRHCEAPRVVQVAERLVSDRGWGRFKVFPPIDRSTEEIQMWGWTLHYGLVNNWDNLSDIASNFSCSLKQLRSGTLGSKIKSQRFKCVPSRAESSDWFARFTRKRPPTSDVPSPLRASNGNLATFNRNTAAIRKCYLVLRRQIAGAIFPEYQSLFPFHTWIHAENPPELCRARLHVWKGIKITVPFSAYIRAY
jgi:hypothetical protein